MPTGARGSVRPVRWRRCRATINTSVNSTSTSSVREPTGACGSCSGHNPSAAPAPCDRHGSPCGHRTPRPSASWGTGTTGSPNRWVASTDRRGSGRSSPRPSPRAAATSTRSPPPKVGPSARRTPWPASPNARRATPAWSLHFESFEWNDDEWMQERHSTLAGDSPMRVYEVHLGSWRRGVQDWDELGELLGDHVARLGFTHVELLPIAEHPFGGSWGYQVSGYYAPTARFGDPDGCRRFVDAMHRTRDRRDRRLGPGALPERRLEPRSFRRYVAVRTSQILAEVNTRTGARTCSTSGATKCGTSSSPTRCTGSTSSTSTVSASTPSPR